jgi:hypothetical protein
MPVTRRTFVKNSSIVLAGASLFSSSCLQPEKRKPSPIQLYSIRDDMKDPLAALKKTG